MKTRDGLLVLVVIGVAGALSFVAFQSGDDAPGPGGAQEAALGGGAGSGATSAVSEPKVADTLARPLTRAADAKPEAAKGAAVITAPDAKDMENISPTIAGAEAGAASKPSASGAAQSTASADKDEPKRPSVLKLPDATPERVARFEPPRAGRPPSASAAAAGGPPSAPKAALEGPAGSAGRDGQPRPATITSDAPKLGDGSFATSSEAAGGVATPPRDDKTPAATGDGSTGASATAKAGAPAKSTALGSTAQPGAAGAAPSREIILRDASPSIALRELGGSRPTDTSPSREGAATARPQIGSPNAGLASPTAPGGPKPPAGASDVRGDAVAAASRPPKADANTDVSRDVNDPKSFPDEPGRSFVTTDSSAPADVAAPKVARSALGAPLVDGAEDPKAATRDAKANVEPKPNDPLAKVVRSGAKAFGAPESPSAPDPAKSAKDDYKRPSFDVVRVKRDGSGILAGRAEPGALVTVLVDGAPSEKVRADNRGEFVVLLNAPSAPPLSIRFDLQAESKDGDVYKSLGPVIVSMRPDPASKPVVVQSTPEGVQLFGPRGRQEKPSGVVIESVTYGSKGEVTVSGSGKPGDVARVYLDNGLEAEARVSPDGDWRVKLARDVPPALYTLRVDQTSTAGVVTSRAETPFERAPSDLVLKEGTVVVQPGNNLWMIADQVYGSGARYTIIYESNRDQIRDPNIIYPGQILALPGQG